MTKFLWVFALTAAIGLLTGVVTAQAPTPVVPAAAPAQTVSVVFYTTETCVYCKQFAPVYERLQKEYGGKVDFYVTHADDGGDGEKAAARVNVRAYPTLDVIRGSTGLVRFEGVSNEGELKAAIDNPEAYREKLVRQAKTAKSDTTSTSACRPVAGCTSSRSFGDLDATYDRIRSKFPIVPKIVDRPADAPVAVIGEEWVTVQEGETDGIAWRVREGRNGSGYLSRLREIPALNRYVFERTEEDNKYSCFDR